MIAKQTGTLQMTLVLINASVASELVYKRESSAMEADGGRDVYMEEMKEQGKNIGSMEKTPHLDQTKQ
ncbi:hypothetical protein YC2023_055651 [Brassica napus]